MRFRGAGTLRRPKRWFAGAALLVAAGWVVLHYLKVGVAVAPAAAREPSRQEEAAIANLRLLGEAQEQFRLRHGRYADSIAELPAGSLSEIISDSLSIIAHQDLAWRGTEYLGDGTCTIFVRDSSLRESQAEVEGAPACWNSHGSTHGTEVRSVYADPSAPGRSFSTRDLGGLWPQHRLDAHRDATVPSTVPSTVPNTVPNTARTSHGFTWTTRVGGELRSSVSIAGNQVFIGAHGNGEVVALTLDSGLVGWRVRVPNWVHHEPAVGAEDVAIGFGNKEEPVVPFRAQPTGFGTPPSGFSVLNRLTGLLHWQQFSEGSVMISPVLIDSSVVSLSNDGVIGKWRLRDGKQLWTHRLDGITPMGNLLLADSLIVMGIEPATVCAIRAGDGIRRFCTKLASSGWGAGEASPALAGNTIVAAFIVKLGQLRRLAAFPGRYGREAYQVTGIDLQSGAIRWQRTVAGTDVKIVGHQAGTAVIAGNIAFIALPQIGKIVAIDATDGALRWQSTVRPARGSVVVSSGRVLSATISGEFVALNASSGTTLCRGMLPGVSDRAGLTISDSTGVLTLTNGVVMARPIAAWRDCSF